MNKIYNKIKNIKPGHYYSELWYTNIISSSQDGYYVENGTKKVLFKFKKTSWINFQI